MSQTTPDVAGYASQENAELHKWAEQAAGRAVENTRDALQRLVTLTTALLAGSAALIAKVPLPFWARPLGPALLLGALALSFFGSLPKRGKLLINVPEEVRAYRDDLLIQRGNYLRAAGLLLMAAFAVLILGILFAGP